MTFFEAWRDVSEAWRDVSEAWRDVSEAWRDKLLRHSLTNIRAAFP